MSGGGTEVAAHSAPAQTETAIEKTPPPGNASLKPEEQDEPPVPTPARSDLQLPAATPSPAPVTTPPPKPSMTPVPNSSAKDAKATPKAHPRKKTGCGKGYAEAFVKKETDTC